MVGKEGAFSPNEPGCGNICSGLVLHPTSFTRDKRLPVHIGLVGACEDLPFPAPARGWRGGEMPRRETHTRRVISGSGTVKGAAGDMVRARARHGRGARSLFVRGDGRGGKSSVFSGQ